MTRKRKDHLSRTRDNDRHLKREGYFRLKKQFLSVASKENINVKSATEAELNQIREKLIQQKKRNTTIKIIAISLSIISGIILFFLLGKIINWYFFQ